MHRAFLGAVAMSNNETVLITNIEYGGGTYQCCLKNPRASKGYLDQEYTIIETTLQRDCGVVHTIENIFSENR